MLEFEDEKNDAETVIKVIGVGGAGGNAVNTMIINQMEGVQFISVNTDIKDLRKCKAPQKVQIGAVQTKGWGAGSDPQVGKRCAEEDRDKLQEAISGADMVFITAGLGGGTGTGASPVIAEIAKDLEALTVAVVTKPFEFEGKIRYSQAEDGVKELRNHVDALIVIPNQKLINAVPENTTFMDAFRRADDILYQGVQSISDLIIKTGYIVVDFSDVKTIMTDAGKALMGIGTESGEDRAIKAAKKAISSPLLEEADIQGAKGLLVNVTGGKDIGIHEINDAMHLIHSSVDQGANVIWGMVIDENLENTVKVTVIATGFDSARREKLIGVTSERSLNNDWDIDDILKDSFDSRSSVRRKRTPMKGGLKNNSGENLEDELAIPAFLRTKLREKKSED